MASPTNRRPGARIGPTLLALALLGGLAVVGAWSLARVVDRGAR